MAYCTVVSYPHLHTTGFELLARVTLYLTDKNLPVRSTRFLGAAWLAVSLRIHVAIIFKTARLSRVSPKR